jgi:hypothetical protein
MLFVITLFYLYGAQFEGLHDVLHNPFLKTDIKATAFPFRPYAFPLIEVLNHETKSTFPLSSNLFCRIMYLERILPQFHNFHAFEKGAEVTNRRVRVLEVVECH